MKKIIALLLVICSVFCLAACSHRTENSADNLSASSTNPSATPTEPIKIPLHRQDANNSAQAEPFRQTIDRVGAPWDSDTSLDIPVYYEEDVLFQGDTYNLTMDSSSALKIPIGESGNGASTQLLHFPSNALRMREDNTSYIIYDTDTNYRLFVFVNEHYRVVGYPIVINKNKLLSYSDFQDIRVGDSMKKVEAIDDVTALYRQYIEKNSLDAAAFERRENERNPVVSTHYTKDGIFKIWYKYSGDDIVISYISFYADFQIYNTYGDKIDYTIKCNDLPVAGAEPDAFPLKRRELIGPTQTGDFRQTLVRIGTSWNSNTRLNIPVYYEEDVLFKGITYYLTRDASRLLNYAGESGNGAASQFFHFPTNALRMREDGSSYMIYDTDTNYRLYIFVNEYSLIVGYPIVINKSKMLSYDDFKNIQIGDPIEKVGAIDDITTLYVKCFERSAMFEMEGNSVAAIHYLKDGILRIDYKMAEKPNIVVSNMTFYKDYIIKTADGKLTSHKIKDIDLPVA